MTTEPKPSAEALLQAIDFLLTGPMRIVGDDIKRRARELTASAPANAPAATGDAVFGEWCRKHMLASGPIKTVSGKDVYALTLPAVDRDEGLDVAISAALSADKASGDAVQPVSNSYRFIPASATVEELEEANRVLQAENCRMDERISVAIRICVDAKAAGFQHVTINGMLACLDRTLTNLSEIPNSSADKASGEVGR